jgi:hypothetical protein
MELKKQIFDLLEPEEKERFINQNEQERFRLQSSQFINRVVLPVFNEIKEEFSRYGRSVDIAMGGFSSEYLVVYPKLCIAIPDGRTFNYWLKFRRTGDNFIIVRYRSIASEGDISTVFKRSLTTRRQLLGDLSEANEEYIQCDIIELYQRCVVVMNTIPLRQPQ